MTITLCGSIKFFDEQDGLAKALTKAGHTVYMPVKAPGVDYWAKDGSKRVAAKRNLDLMSKHMDKIKKSDAILVANYTKHDIQNYIGANTFAEMVFAHYLGKKIYLLNPKPSQDYIIEEVDSMDVVLLNGSVDQIVL